MSIASHFYIKFEVKSKQKLSECTEPKLCDTKVDG